jgi:hypothetical protein
VKHHQDAQRLIDKYEELTRHGWLPDEAWQEAINEVLPDTPEDYRALVYTHIMESENCLCAICIRSIMETF